MNKFYLTPGPSQLYFTLEEHMKNALKYDVPSISHRSKAFESIYAYTVEELTELLGIPDHYSIYFTSSATEVWERAIQNLVQSESFHLVNGAFSRRFSEISRELGRNVITSEVPEGKVENINSLLIPETSEMICLTHNETSTGAMMPLEDIYQLRKSFPDQLISVDIVSSCPDVNLDLNQVDMAYFSVQKCFGLPAGLGVWLLNDRCLDKASQLSGKGFSTGSYHSITSLDKKARIHQTPETPNVLGIYLLGKVAADMNKKGIQQIRQEISYKSALLYHTIESSDVFVPFVTNPVNRSRTTIVAQLVSGDNTEILKQLENKGFVIGKGYGGFKQQHIRIANFPTHSKEQIEMVSDILAG